MHVQPAVQRRHGLVGLVLEDREMQQVDVEMQDVELPRTASHFVEHRQVRGDVGFQRCGVQPDRALTDRYQPGGGVRIRGGEQRDVMAELHQCITENRDDSFGATVKLGGDGFCERRDLGNVHGR